MKVVGLTGGIGSGKSTVAKIWEKLGVIVLNADEIAKNIMVNDQTVINSIKVTFGEQAYLNDGSLNKNYLRKEAFEKGRVQELNDIVHPKVFEFFEREKKKAQQNDKQILVREAALINQETKTNFDVIVGVFSPKMERVNRVKKRDQLSEDEIFARMDKQLTEDEFKSFVDFSIENDGDLKQLENRAIEIFKEIKNGLRN